MYLVRGADGTMRTIVAFSSRGAINIYLTKYSADKGDILSVKPRGRGDWEDFRVQ
jgi:hypothetical protein